MKILRCFATDPDVLPPNRSGDLEVRIKAKSRFNRSTQFKIEAVGSSFGKVKKTWEDFEALYDSMELRYNEDIKAVPFPRYATRKDMTKDEAVESNRANLEILIQSLLRHPKANLSTARHPSAQCQILHVWFICCGVTPRMLLHLDCSDSPAPHAVRRRPGPGRLPSAHRHPLRRLRRLRRRHCFRGCSRAPARQARPNPLHHPHSHWRQRRLRRRRLRRFGRLRARDPHFRRPAPRGLGRGRHCAPGGRRRRRPAAGLGATGHGVARRLRLSRAVTMPCRAPCPAGARGVPGTRARTRRRSCGRRAARRDAPPPPPAARPRRAPPPLRCRRGFLPPPHTPPPGPRPPLPRVGMPPERESPAAAPAAASPGGCRAPCGFWARTPAKGTWALGKGFRRSSRRCTSEARARFCSCSHPCIGRSFRSRCRRPPLPSPGTATTTQQAWGPSARRGEVRRRAATPGEAN